MRYFVVPMVNGEIPITYPDLIEAYSIDGVTALVCVESTIVPERDWVECREEDFLAAKEARKQVDDKSTDVEQLSQIKENQLIIMGAIADLYMMMGGE